MAAKEAYEAFSSLYDAFNHFYQYERWTGRLLAAAEAEGLEGNRLLDVACGTGLSFIPLLENGWQVTGCDLSPAMLELARAKVGDRAELLVADMRTLPRLGQFDLIWSVNAPFNHLLTEGELREALESMARNLAPRGLVVFDVNTLALFRSFFGETQVGESDGERFVWHGEASPDSVEPGGIYEARFETEGGSADHLHRQRHFPEPEVKTAIEAAGLRCRAVLGERNGDLERGLDESKHTKAVYVCSLGG